MEPHTLMYALNEFKVSYHKILLNYTHYKLKKVVNNYKKLIYFRKLNFRVWLLGNHTFVKIFLIQCATWIYMVARYIC